MFISHTAVVKPQRFLCASSFLYDLFISCHTTEKDELLLGRALAWQHLCFLLINGNSNRTSMLSDDSKKTNINAIKRAKCNVMFLCRPWVSKGLMGN